ncbi:MAG: 6-phosphofructokinase [Kiritimatiellae bacterium]|nr:6-phosphofructokinase [Kiritimatiellia bacterium]
MQQIAVLTSGGDSPGMNAAVRAVVRAGLNMGFAVKGIIRGYQGLLDECFEAMTSRSVSGIINQGGTILKSARCKDFYEDAGVARGAEILKRHKIDGLVVVGGDGSYRGARKLAEQHGIAVVGAPGTIDNDISGTDYTIGFDTAVGVALEAVDRIRDTATSHDRLFIVEVMGRHSGHLALAVGLAGGAEMVVLPETPTDVEGICRALKQMRERGKTSSLIVYAEGDEFGSSIELGKQIEARTHYSVRVSVLGYIQRGGPPTANDRILATRLGAAAVDELAAGRTNVAVGVVNQKVVTVSLEQAAEQRKPLRRDLVELCGVMAT